jgi:hypothetical protein
VAKKYSGVDSSPWKLVKGNTVVVDAKGVKQDSFKGYKDAREASLTHGGVPVRV